jgi:hypothetical protein
MTKHETLAAALAAFQASLPAVHKGAKGQVPGKRDYKYADLADMSATVLPALAAQGLSWMTLPTMNDHSQFVLRYELLHESGQSRTGEYPLPTGTAWEVGSAISYGRRYCLSAVTGVAADEDDDGAMANGAGPARQRPQPVPAQDTADAARLELAALADSISIPRPVVAAEYAARMKTPLGDETDVKRIRTFLEQLKADPHTLIGMQGKAA